MNESIGLHIALNCVIVSHEILLDGAIAEVFVLYLTKLLEYLVEFDGVQVVLDLEGIFRLPEVSIAFRKVPRTNSSITLMIANRMYSNNKLSAFANIAASSLSFLKPWIFRE